MRGRRAVTTTGWRWTCRKSQMQARKKKRGKASDEFKAKVMRILEKNDFAEKRASKMSQDDFMQLLADFNEQGVHFA